LDRHSAVSLASQQPQLGKAGAISAGSPALPFLSDTLEEGASDAKDRFELDFETIE
jgi:hypothetical protein